MESLERLPSADDLPRMNVVFVGHVDHGKSTTIGRLCYDTGTLSPDKVAEIERISRELGRPVEFAFAMDHLEEERSGGLTIDTAQMFFKSPLRQYVIIDAPGHREFLKNMLTGASQAEAALLVVDAGEGIREQTRRHGFLLSLLNVRHVVVLVNKMDVIGYSAERFRQLTVELAAFFQSFGVRPRTMIPISAAEGDNIVNCSARMPWYDGRTVLEELDSLEKRTAPVDQAFRLPVQNVYPVDDRSIAAGRIEAGLVRVGDEIAIVPGGRSVRVRTVEEFGRVRTQAEAGESIGVTFEGDVAVARGDVLSDVNNVPGVSGKLRCSVFWLSDRELSPSDVLTVRLATQERRGRISAVYERMDSSTLEVIEREANSLHETEVGKVLIEMDRPIAFEPFLRVPELGRFVLERDHDVVAGGTVLDGKAD